MYMTLYLHHIAYGGAELPAKLLRIVTFTNRDELHTQVNPKYIVVILIVFVIYCFLLHILLLCAPSLWWVINGNAYDEIFSTIMVLQVIHAPW